MTRSTNTGWNEDEATGKKIPSEHMGMTYSAPPLGKWTAAWVHNGFDRERIVNIAIDTAEDKIRRWKLGGDEPFAVLNRNIAYEQLGDILNWLYGDGKRVTRRAR